MLRREAVEPRNNFVTPDQGLHLLEVSAYISEMRKSVFLSNSSLWNGTYKVLTLPK